MNKMVRFGLWPILLVCAALPLVADSGPSTNGSFEFIAASGPLTFEFNARLQNKGSINGEITLTGSVELPDQDVDGEGTDSRAGVTPLSLKVNVDCLVVSDNRAAFGGKVVDSNVEGYIGNQVVMAVEDNGEGSKAPPDRFTWGLYGVPSLTWVATDAELEFDSGVGLSWLATDFEREDDVGKPSNASTVVDCKSFPLSSYSFEIVTHGAGNIQVKP